jgi:hypothetical protein
MVLIRNQGRNVSTDCSFCLLSCLGPIMLGTLSVGLGVVVHWLMTQHEDTSEEYCVSVII